MPPDVDDLFLASAKRRGLIDQRAADRLKKLLRQGRAEDPTLSMFELAVNEGAVSIQTAHAIQNEVSKQAPQDGDRTTARVEKAASEKQEAEKATGKPRDPKAGRKTTSRAARAPAYAAGTIIEISETTSAGLRKRLGLSPGVQLATTRVGGAMDAAGSSPEAGARRYVVVREIASGGMGRVIEVEDPELRRTVALKQLRRDRLNRRDLVERFLEEAQITGQLEHPSIVPVHELGIDSEGNVYFTMKLVEGEGLNEILLHLREGNQNALREYPLPRLIELFIKICDGLAFAHARGVVHRDLKPANIMVGRFGEVQIMDWGVARIVGRTDDTGDGDVVLTDRMGVDGMYDMTGIVVGTPAYMSPEQARGEAHRIGPASDVFALGVILYEMLTLRTPWTGRNADEIVAQVRECEIRPPSTRNPDRRPPQELEELVLRCLRKEPEERLSSARELAENLRSYQQGLAMRAVRYSPLQRLGKFLVRHRAKVRVALLVFLAVAFGAAATTWYQQDAARAKAPEYMEEAEDELAEAEEARNRGDLEVAEAALWRARDAYSRAVAADPANEEARQGVRKVGDLLADLWRKDD